MMALREGGEYACPKRFSEFRQDLRFVKFFAQPDFGIRRKFFEAAISTRFTGLHYYRINTTLNTAGATIPEVDYIRSHASSFLAEPAFIIRAGHPSVKFQLQVSNSFNLTAPDAAREDNDWIWPLHQRQTPTPPLNFT
jgi:hypothetical protein